MPDAETGAGSGEVARIRAEIKDEITKADTAQKRAELAQRLLQDLKDAETPAKEFVTELKKGNANEKRDEGKQVKRALIRAAEAAKEGINVTSKANAQKILVELADKSLSDTTASAIENNLKDYLYGNKDITFSQPGTNQPKSQFEEAFEQLKQTNSTAAETVRDVLVDQSAQLGQTQDVIRDKFKVEEGGTGENLNEQQRRVMEQLGISDERTPFGQDKSQFYQNRIKTPDDLRLLESLYDRQKFLKYVKANLGERQADMDAVDDVFIEQANRRKESLKTHIEDRLRVRGEALDPARIADLVDREMREQVSRGIATRLTNMLDKVHVQLARERATESYEEIAQKDFLHGIAATVAAMRKAIQGLQQDFAYRERHGDADVNRLKLFRGVEAKSEPDKVKIQGTEIDKTMNRLHPLANPAEVSISEYLKNLEVIFGEYTHSRAYLHNVNTIYNSPAGEHGFWGGLSGYAEKLTGGDLDALMSLPDGGLVLEAYQLYEKYLDEQFALQDWRHDPDQFTTKKGNIYSQLEEELMSALRIAHPDMDEDRLTSALYMAKGISRGVFLTEPEKSGYADPPLTPSGGGTATSYYTNDATGLMVFNPMHLFVRWQGEANLPAWLFMPVDGDSKSKIYNHKVLYNDIIKFRESYWKGRKGMGGKKVLIDDLVDFGNVGGPAKRRGWRMLWSAQDYYVFKKDAQGNILHKGGFPQEASPQEDVLKTWQSVEKIGWEVVYDYVVNGRIDQDFLMKKESAGERTEFFKYLFKTYFGQDESQFDAYINNLRKTTKDSVYDAVRHGKSHPTSIDEQIELNTSNTFLFRALSRFIARRFPSKIIKLNRDRFEEDGVSRWRKVFNALNRDGVNWDQKKFDGTMKKLGLAETLLRTHVSDQIKERFKEGTQNMYELTDIKHELSEDVIRDLFGKQIREAGALGRNIDLTNADVEDVITLFKKINALYTGKESGGEAEKFLDGYGKLMKEKPDDFYTFTYGMEDTDVSLLLFKRAGPRIIPRAVGDISQMEQHMINGAIMKMQTVFQDMAIGEKKGDFSPIVNILKEVMQAYVMVHGQGAGYEAVHKLAAATITYFKKDTLSKGILGIFNVGRPNSIAAEIAGRSSAVWEWDAAEIDKFIIQLESNNLLKKNPYDMSLPPTHESVWFTPSHLLGKTPLIGSFLEKISSKIPILKKSFVVGKKRKADYAFNGHSLREKFGGDAKHIAFDFLVKYGPLFLAFMLWKFMKESYDEAQGKKK